tara:strand:+ start:155 stop:526 length:372 start_codon:yes stop_codon:yes gene_type:complete
MSLTTENVIETMNAEMDLNAITDQQILAWMALKAKQSGIPEGTIHAWISECQKLYKNEANGCFMVSGKTPMGRKSSESFETLEAAVANWKTFHSKTPEQQANELRAEAKVLLRKASEIEGSAQ